jgi:hypothetical protein
MAMAHAMQGEKEKRIGDSFFFTKTMLRFYTVLYSGTVLSSIGHYWIGSSLFNHRFSQSVRKASGDMVGMMERKIPRLQPTTTVARFGWWNSCPPR